jgi:hypothetical protein
MVMSLAFCVMVFAPAVSVRRYAEPAVLVVLSYICAPAPSLAIVRLVRLPAPSCPTGRYCR